MKNFTCYVPARRYERGQFHGHAGESGGACVPSNKEDIVNICRASLD